MTEPEPTDAQISQAILLLSKLAASPDKMLDRSSPQFETYKSLRAEMSRCVASIQRSAVADRKSFVLASAPKPRRAANGAVAGASRPSCYMCNEQFVDAWPRNAMVCRKCGLLNEHFRSMNADLSGQHAVVTGGRMGVGFAVVQRLLQCGATVHVTTRFPYDAARRFVAAWGSSVEPTRLRIYGLDFRDLAAIRRFVEVIRAQLNPDILINNAA